MSTKIGIIGTNFISDTFCEAALQVPGAELYAVYSRKQTTQTTILFLAPASTQSMSPRPILSTARRHSKL